MEGLIERGEAPDPRRGNVTFGEIAEDWLAGRRDKAPTTLARDRSYLDSLVLPTFGHRPLSAINRRLVDSWVGKLIDDGKAPATVRKAGQLVHAVLALAVSDRLILRNPADGVSYPKAVRDEPTYMTVDEVGALTASMEPRDSLMVWLMAGTGLRIGEVLALRWQDVDLDTARLRVTRTVQEVNGHLTYASETKTAAGMRTVTLPAGLVGELTDWREGADLDRLVFTDTKGGGLRPRNWRKRRFKPAAEAAGLDVTPHDLRHTHVAWLIEQGVHAKAIQARLGHASIQVTLDTYGHLMAGMDESAAEAVDSLLYS